MSLQRVTLNTQELSSGSIYLRNASELHSDLISLQETLGNLTFALLDEADAGVNELKDGIIDWWKVDNKRAVLERKNAIELSGFLEMTVNRLIAGVETDIVREIMRNGPAETLHCVSQIITNRIKYHKSTFSSSQQVLVIPLFLLFYSILALLIGLSVCFSVKLSRQRKRLMQEFASLQTDQVLNFHTNVANRLEQVHEYEYVPCRVRSSRKLSYTLSRIQKGVWLLLIVAFGITIACFQANYQVTFSNLQNTLEKQPFIFEIVEGTKSSLASVLLWMREAKKAPSEPTFSSYMPFNNPELPPFSVLSRLLQDLATQYQGLRGRGEAYSSDMDITSSHFDFLYTKSAFEEADLHCGFSPAVFNLPNSVFSCVNSGEKSYFEACLSVEKTIFTLISLSGDNNSFFHSSMSLQASQALTSSLVILSIYAGTILIYLLFLYIPVACALLLTIKRELEVYLLLVNMSPSDSVSAGKQLTTAKTLMPSGAIGTKTPSVVFGP
jgi:hypothetical protein